MTVPEFGQTASVGDACVECGDRSRGAMVRFCPRCYKPTCEKCALREHPNSGNCQK